MHPVRQPAVAAAFYPGQGQTLASTVASLLAAQRHHLQPRLLTLCNSGDTAGDKQRVVGHASIAFTETPHAIH